MPVEKHASFKRPNALLKKIFDQDVALSWYDLWKNGWRCAVLYKSTNVEHVDAIESNARPIAHFRR
jgi:hypothetical protein